MDTINTEQQLIQELLDRGWRYAAIARTSGIRYVDLWRVMNRGQQMKYSVGKKLERLLYMTPTVAGRHEYKKD